MEYDLDRFVKAHAGEYLSDYDTALSEIRRGRKTSHWMWYIFPQIDGLGKSDTAKRYAIKSIGEAKAYYAHPVLGAHLIEITKALLELESDDPDEVMGWYIDAAKLRSCMTLFANAVPDNDIFEMVLDKYFDGEYDSETLDRI